MWNRLSVGSDYGTLLKNCTTRFMVVGVFLSRQGQRWGHANVLILDFHHNVYQLFDPHGFGKDGYTAIERVVNNASLRLDGRWKMSLQRSLVTPGRRHRAGPQSLQARFRLEEGYCVVWTFLWVHLVLANPHTGRNELMDYLMDRNPEEMLNIIERYMTFVLQTVKPRKNIYLTADNFLYSADGRLDDGDKYFGGHWMYSWPHEAIGAINRRFDRRRRSPALQDVDDNYRIIAS
ncbi:uncharacterized protein EV422DRAFT_273069 [Fimicolochytrium jonesii]|uniref:uncharacterized protein n=1 Tax=Fimicolochytrium jonesii TaxID=1396493 RepID=UPI0022FE8599|nr:uncharacterized protein EV422DRAFT_273069 [Fimicolochytrium jonesii]KAI8816878.1 hypothetical protein EV422DRAFT_273069 [Fimicolochytrium jonesii]